jgi:large subunit ribosomal protein L27
LTYITLLVILVLMAHTKAKGSTKLGRDSESKRLGVKLFNGESVGPGQIIIRQRGTKFNPGYNVARGSDDTLYAKSGGIVSFSTKRKVSFNRKQKIIKIVSVNKEK